MTEIKICGITREEEALWLGEEQVQYAGFVLYEKSKRFITITKAQQIFEKLNKDITKVAVTVSPDREQIKQVEKAGFDVLQIHGTFDRALLAETSLPVWLAVNLSGMEELRRWRCGEEIAGGEDGMKNVSGVLFDAGSYGSGQTFGWEQSKTDWKQDFDEMRSGLAARGIRFILAGGLNRENVAEGIRTFSPDVVDVSSGVEEFSDGRAGKSREKITAFVQAVRKEA